MIAQRSRRDSVLIFHTTFTLNIVYFRCRLRALDFVMLMPPRCWFRPRARVFDKPVAAMPSPRCVSPMPPPRRRYVTLARYIRDATIYGFH